MGFKQLPPDLLDLGEMEEELVYTRKRIYRLEKLMALGKEVEPDLQILIGREADLDIAVRLRRRGMAEIPF